MEDIWSVVKPLTSGQEEMFNALNDKNYEVLGFFGPTGTGKSLFSLAYGVHCVLNNKYTRFIIIRPVVDIITGEEIVIAKMPQAFVE
ncbi:MAG: PhoH family protein, partial [Ignisphaera sp.]